MSERKKMMKLYNYDETVSTGFRTVVSVESYLLSQNSSAEGMVNSWSGLVAAVVVGIHDCWHTGKPPAASWWLGRGVRSCRQMFVCVSNGSMCRAHGSGSVLRGDLAGNVPRTACSAEVFLCLYRWCSPQLAAENFFQLVQ